MIHIPSPRDCFARYRATVQAAWLRWQQTIRTCADCRRRLVVPENVNEACRCGGGE